MGIPCSQLNRSNLHLASEETVRAKAMLLHPSVLAQARGGLIDRCGFVIHARCGFGCQKTDLISTNLEIDGIVGDCEVNR